MGRFGCGIGVEKLGTFILGFVLIDERCEVAHWCLEFIVMSNVPSSIILGAESYPNSLNP